MKKCILIGALAALMLFAFTACDNQVSITGTPVGMTATVSKVNYLVGQEIDLSTISATVDFSGNVSKTFSGNEIAFVGNTAATAPGTNPLEVQSGANQLTFAYGSVNSQGDISGAMAMVTVYGYKAKTVTLNNMPTTAAKTNSDGTISLDTSAATSAVNGLLVRWEKADGTVVETPYVDQMKAEAGSDKVTIKVYTTIDGKISGNALAATAYKVYGSVAALPSGENLLPTQDKAVTVSLVYVADPSVTTGFTYYGVDYATKLTVTTKAGSGATNVAQGGAVSTVIDKVEVTYASGTKSEVTNYVLSPSTIPADQPAGSATVYAYLAGAGKDGITLVDDFTVTVTV